MGVLLYRLLTGRPPFRGRTPLETLRNIERCKFVPTRRSRADVTRDLETIVLKCLQEYPEDRYASARRLREDLESVREGRPILGRRIGPVARIAGYTRRRPLAAAALGFVILPVLLLLTLAVLTPRSGVIRGGARS